MNICDEKFWFQNEAKETGALNWDCLQYPGHAFYKDLRVYLPTGSKVFSYDEFKMNRKLDGKHLVLEPGSAWNDGIKELCLHLKFTFETDGVNKCWWSATPDSGVNFIVEPIPGKEKFVLTKWDILFHEEHPDSNPSTPLKDCLEGQLSFVQVNAAGEHVDPSQIYKVGWIWRNKP